MTVIIPECLLIGGDPKKSFRDKRIETFLLITVAVCCGNVSNLIGRRTINIPEIIFGVHASSVLTVRPNWTQLGPVSIEYKIIHGVMSASKQ